MDKVCIHDFNSTIEKKLFQNTLATILRRENCSHTLWQSFSDVNLFDEFIFLEDELFQ
jgi:hypothetical protein